MFYEIDSCISLRCVQWVLMFEIYYRWNGVDTPAFPIPCPCPVVQRSPSSFNAQPWVMIAVQSADQRARLARCMVGGINSARVAAAPLSVVFAADLQAASSSRDLQVLERGTGKGVRYLRSLETDLAAFSSFTGWTAEHIIKEAALRAGGSLGVQLPTVNVPEAWAFKNAAFAAQTLLLGATAHGLASCVMEGFNGDAVRSVCKVPPRYGIPLIVALGYAAPPPREPSDGAAAPSPRYALHEAARLDSFEEPLPPPAGTSAGSNGSE